MVGNLKSWYLIDLSYDEDVLLAFSLPLSNRSSGLVFSFTSYSSFFFFCLLTLDVEQVIIINIKMWGVCRFVI